MDDYTHEDKVNTVYFKIDGVVPSFKNSKNVIKVKGRLIPMTKPEYKKKMDNMIVVIQEQSKKQKWHISNDFKYKVHCDFYLSTNHRRDIDNMVSAVMDCLVRAKALPDDCWQVVPKISAEAYKSDKSEAQIRVSKL